MQQAVAFSNIEKAVQDQCDAQYAQGLSDGQNGAPAPTGVSSDQEAADIAAAVKPFQDQLAALQADDDTKTELNIALNDTVAKIKALLA